MNSSELDERIFSRIKGLNGDQKSVILEYLDTIPPKIHSTRRYRRKALKQIRQALSCQ